MAKAAKSNTGLADHLRPGKFSTRSRLLAFMAVFVLVGLAVVVYTLASSTTIKNGVGLCLDNPAGLASPNHQIVLWTCHGGINQQWDMPADHTIRVQGLCLDDPGGATANGTGVILYTCHGGTNQQWVQQANGTLRNSYAGLCIDDPMASTRPGTVPVLWACHGGINQQWSLPQAAPAPVGPPTGAITLHGAKCLDVRNNDHFQGNWIWLWHCNQGTAQQWVLQPDGTIRNGGWCLDVRLAGRAIGTQVWLWGCNANPAQIWAVQSSGQLMNPNSGLCLEDQFGTTYDSSALDLGRCSGGNNRQWQITGNVGPVGQPDALPRRLGGDPPANVAQDSDYQAHCIDSYVSEADCDRYVVKAINVARIGEGVPPIILPVNYDTMNIGGQSLAVINAERVDRGFLPIKGTNPQLDAMAMQGAAKGADPIGPNGYSWGANWGNFPTSLQNHYEMMYKDAFGPGDTNFDCVKAGDAGCLGHRHNILNPYDANTSLGAARKTVGSRDNFAWLMVKDW